MGHGARTNNVEHWNPAPADLDTVLSPEWLSAALSVRFPGTVVTSVQRGPEVTRLGTNARFSIQVEQAPDALPRSLCVKGYFAEHMRAHLAMGFEEASFYRDVVLRSEVRTLPCAYAGVDDTTKHGVVITGDLHEAGGSFLDALSPYTADQVAASLEQLAALHAASWRADWVLALGFLRPRIDTFRAFRGVDAIESNFADERIGAEVPIEVKDPARIFRALDELDRRAKTEPVWSVIHGDAHVGNVFLDADGHPGLLDWQIVQRAPWYFDVGYHIASALPTDERRRNERDLVAHYVERLGAHGVDTPDGEEAWSAYRAGVAYGFWLWAVTRSVPVPLTARLVQRLSAAAADLGSLELLAP